MTDEELTVRIGIIQDRMSQLELFNNKETVYLPFIIWCFSGGTGGVSQSRHRTWWIP